MLNEFQVFFKSTDTKSGIREDLKLLTFLLISKSPTQPKHPVAPALIKSKFILPIMIMTDIKYFVIENLSVFFFFLII